MGLTLRWVGAVAAVTLLQLLGGMWAGRYLRRHQAPPFDARD